MQRVSMKFAKCFDSFIYSYHHISISASRDTQKRRVCRNMMVKQNRTNRKIKGNAVPPVPSLGRALRRLIPQLRSFSRDAKTKKNRKCLQNLVALNTMRVPLITARPIQWERKRKRRATALEEEMLQAPPRSCSCQKWIKRPRKYNRLPIFRMREVIRGNWENVSRSHSEMVQDTPQEPETATTNTYIPLSQRPTFDACGKTHLNQIKPCPKVLEIASTRPATSV